jgi:hypothetical protein
MPSTGCVQKKLLSAPPVHTEGEVIHIRNVTSTVFRHLADHQRGHVGTMRAESSRAFAQQAASARRTGGHLSGKAPVIMTPAHLGFEHVFDG